MRGKKFHSDVAYQEGDFIILGKETTGLPQEIVEPYQANIIRIPMGGATRSINLSNCAAIQMQVRMKQISDQWAFLL